MKLIHYPFSCILSMNYDGKSKSFSIFSRGARLARSFLTPASSKATVNSWSSFVGWQFITMPGPNLLWRTWSPTFSARGPMGGGEGWKSRLKSGLATGVGLSSHRPLGLIRCGEMSWRKREGGFAVLPPNRLRR